MSEQKVFTKLIRENNVERALLPLAFRRSLAYDIGATITLRVNSCRPFEIGPTYDLYEDKLWMDARWREFRETFALENGDILTFKFNEDEQIFKVSVEDDEGNKLTYKPSYYAGDPPNLFDAGRVVRGSEAYSRESADTESAMSEDDYDSYSDLSDSEDEDYKPTNLPRVKVGSTSAGVVRGTVNENEHPRYDSTSRLEKSTSSAWQQALQARSNRKHFAVYMVSGYVSGRYIVAIPKAFAETEFTAERTEIRLRMKGLRSTTDVVVRNWGPFVRLTKGWKSFVQQYNICEGDAVLFEVDKRDNSMYLVTVFKD